METTYGRKLLAVSGALAAALTAGLTAAPLASAAVSSSAQDTTAPTVPTNLRQIGVYLDQPIIGWDASSDDSGQINYYSVLANGTQIYRPRAASVRVLDLVRFCHLIPGRTYTITIKAVDSSGNKSAASAPIQVIGKALPS
jgi:hypothetical protein